MSERTRATVAVCLLLLVSGCIGPLAGPFAGNTDETTTPTGGGSDGTAPYGVVDLYVDEYDDSNGTHRMDIRVTFKAPYNDSLEPTTFEDVMVCFYDEDGTVLNGTSLGDFDTPKDEGEAALISATRPTYITADHPHWGSYGKMDIEYGVLRSDGTFDLRHQPREGLGEAFGYPRHDDVGRCM